MICRYRLIPSRLTRSRSFAFSKMARMYVITRRSALLSARSIRGTGRVNKAGGYILRDGVGEWQAMPSCVLSRDGVACHTCSS